jgi:hypothetical protein
MTDKEIMVWLIAGDISIKYQTRRDLLSEDIPELQKRIESEGWGAKFLSKRRKEGHWGKGFYQPKWTSSHYTLLDLRNLCIHPDNKLIQESIELIAQNEKSEDGGINPARSISESDVCINGMFLNYASYFKIDKKHLKSVVDFILSQRLDDGGFNCRLNRSGAVHSSLHSTLSILEGITEYEKNGYKYKLKELKDAEKSAREFILMHKLFISDRTGEIIDNNFLKLSYPGRWKFDILRALDYFQYSGLPWDDRLIPALEILDKKRMKDNRWFLQAKHPGQLHFEMEKAGTASRWNTLRALRVIKHFQAQKPKKAKS